MLITLSVAHITEFCLVWLGLSGWTTAGLMLRTCYNLARNAQVITISRMFYESGAQQFIGIAQSGKD